MGEEELLLRMVAEGFTETAEAIQGVTDSLDEMAARADAAAESVGSAEASGGKGRGVVGALGSFKALIAGFAIDKSLKAFSSFQSQMEKLRTQTGSTQSEVGRMSKGILSMAASVGTGPQSLAQALYHIESAGYRGKAALDALRIAAEGAQVGGADLTDTTTGLTAVMVAGYAKGRNAVQQMKSAMGQLNATVGAGDMTFQDLNDALGTGILGTFKVLGLQVKDLGAGLAVLGDNNIRGSAAATRLRMGLMMLIHPSTTAAEAMNRIHLKTYQLAEDLRKPDGLLKMLETLRSHLAGMSKTQQAATLASIFGGGRNSAAMLLLIDQLGRLKQKYDDIGRSGHDFNSEWKATTHTLQFFLDQLKALGQVLLIKVGGALAVVAGWIKAVATGFQQGKLWAQLIVAVASAIAIVVAGVKAWTMAQKLLNFVMDINPWILALTALIAVIVLLIMHWKTVKEVVSRIFSEWGKWFSAAWGWIKHVADIVGGALASAFDSVKKVVTDLWHIVQKVFNFIIGKGGTVSKIFSYLNPVGDAAHLFNGAKGLVGDIAGAFATGTDYVPHTGSYLVGEQGPEIVNLRQGSQVIPNNEIGGLNGSVPLEAEITLINELDGKPVSRQVVRQSLMASARRGAGNATLVTAGG